ncbi:ATP-binding protein [Thalassotalea montiporae]
MYNLTKTNAIGSIRRHLSSIKVKLFLWFWIVTICAIAATRFVSIQLSQQYVEIDTDKGDLRRLTRISDVIHQAQPRNLAKFIHNNRHRRTKRSFKHLMVKPLSNNQPVIGGHPEHPYVNQFIQANVFDNTTTWIFPHSQITGPVKLEVRGQQYLAFYKRHTSRIRTIGFFMQQLPYWARIGTPVIVSFALCWLLARSLSRPLSNITKVADRFGQGDLAVRVENDDKRSDELGTLAKAFNQMADKLSDNVSAHQRLLGDVSHELRSPLTRLQMALALAQKHKDDHETLEQYIARSEREVARLDEMIEHVLTLSRLENSAQAISKQPCYLKPLLDHLVDDGNFLGQDKQVQVNLNAAGNPQLNLDEALIASAVGNIICNAIKYSPSASIVLVELTETAEHVVISVSDQGNGVPDLVLSKLFEPFYRVASARDRLTGGTGLGLAIAKQAVLAHRGEISAKNNSEGGLTVTISLPKV